MAFPSRSLTQLLGSNGPVHALTYSSSPSTYILTGSADRTIRLYNPSRPSNPSFPTAPSQLIQSYSAHGYEVLSLTVATDNASFASAGGDRAVFLWDVSTAKTIRRFHGHSARINAVSFAGEGDSLLASGSYDSTVRIWDLKQQGNNSKPVMTLEDARDSVSCLYIQESDIWAGSTDGKVRRYDIRMGRVSTDVLGAPVTSLRGTRDGRGILVGCTQGGIRLMDTDTGGCLKTYAGEGWKNEEYRLWSTFGANERWVLCGNEDVGGEGGEVVVWETVSGNIVQKVKVQGAKNEMGKRKIIVGSDGKAREKKNVISCVAWKDNGRGDQWCCAGTDGVVTVFGPS